MTGELTDEQVDELVKPVLLRLSGRAFACRPAVPQWSLMKLASAMSRGDEMLAMGAMYDFLKVLVVPEAWADFEAFMLSVDIEHSQLDEAIGTALAEMGGRGKGSGAPSSPSSAGSPPPETPAVSRVVSLSRGTVEEVAQPSLSDAATSFAG